MGDSISFTIIARDLASRAFRAVGREAWAMALKVKAANSVMDRSFWHGSSQFKLWMRVIVLGLPLIPPLIIATSNALAGLNSILISVIPGIGFLTAALIGNFSRIKKEAGFAELTRSWKEFLDATRGTSLRVLTESFRILGALLPRMVPIVNAFGATLTNWLRSLQDQMERPGFEKFLVWLRTVGAANFGSLLKSIENLAVGLANLAMAFSESGRDIGQWLVGITNKFRNWSASLKGGDSLGGFVSYFKSTWPQLKNLVNELVTAFSRLLQAIAPLSNPLMRFATAFLQAFNKIPVNVLTDLIVAFLALKAAAYGFAAAQWAVNIAMAANPVGAVIAVLMALVAAFILAYRHSATFRRAVNRGFQAVAAAGRQLRADLAPIFNWFNSPQGARAMGIASRVAANQVHLAAATIVGAFRTIGGVARTVFGAVRNQVAMVRASFGALRAAANTAANVIVGALRNIMAAWSRMVGALRNIPSFGWALSAASALNAAAGAAWNLAGAIGKLASMSIGGGLLSKIPRIPGFATGGRPPVGKVAWVGEKGPELFVPDRPGTVVPAEKSAAMAVEGSDPNALANAVAKALARVLAGASLWLVDDTNSGRKAYIITGGAS